MKRKSPIIQIIIFILFAFLQGTVFHEKLGVSIFIPDFVFILFLFFAIQNGKKWGYLTGFIAGMLIHPFMMPDTVLGLYPFIFTLIGYFAGNLKGKIIVDSFFIPLAYIFFALLIKYLLLFFFSLFPGMPIFIDNWLHLLINYVITLIATLVLYNLLKIFKIIDLNERC